MDETFAEARDQLTAFRHAEGVAYAVALVKAGLALLDRGVTYFGSDDVPEDVSPGGGIPGSAVESLRNAHVIADFWQTIPEQRIYGGRRKSKRASANGRKIALYGLASRTIAETYLARNGVKLPRSQMELAM